MIRGHVTFDEFFRDPIEDRKALEDFRSSPPAFLTVSAKRKTR